jgi:hypothetical protein
LNLHFKVTGSVDQKEFGGKKDVVWGVRRFFYFMNRNRRTFHDIDFQSHLANRGLSILKKYFQMGKLAFRLL